MGRSLKKNIKANDVRCKPKPATRVTCGELREQYAKHPFVDLNGRYYAYDIDGRVLGYVEYRGGVVVSKKTYKEQKKKDGSSNRSKK